MKQPVVTPIAQRARCPLRDSRALGPLLALALAAGAMPSLAPLLQAGTAQAGTEDVAATQAEVRQIQKQLNALGYEAGPVDGVYGEITYQAILQFERDHDLTPIGMPDEAVRKRIAEALARQRAEKSAPAEDSAGPEPTQDAEPDGQRAGDANADVLDLTGTRWRLHHPQWQNIVLAFRQGGVVEAPAGSWRWERNDGRIVIHYDSGRRLTSRLIGELSGPRRMTGWGRDTFGERWEWSADRLPARNES